MILCTICFCDKESVIYIVHYHARAVEEIKREVPNAQIEWLECDLGNLRYDLQLLHKLARKSGFCKVVPFAAKVSPGVCRGIQKPERTFALPH